MEILRDPFLWALLSMAAIAPGDGIVSNVLPRSRLLGLLVVSSFMLGRTILVLPFCIQPRFDLAGMNLALGFAVIAVACACLLPSLRVHWTTGPDEAEELRTTGIYGFVRHPGYLGNVLLGLGWALLFGSTIGVFIRGPGDDAANAISGADNLDPAIAIAGQPGSDNFVFVGDRRLPGQGNGHGCQAGQAWQWIRIS